MSKRITCKIHDNQQRVVEVGVEGEGPRQMLEVWDRIKRLGEEFYTYEVGRRARVEANQHHIGRKYLTTHPDRVTENNLDELRNC